MKIKFKPIKKIISAALATLMTISLFPFNAGFEVYAEEDPYIELSQTLTAQDTFAWTEYDHDNFTDRYAPSIPDHIIYDGDNIKMIGYGYSAFKDFLLINDTENKNSKKTFTFKIKRDSSDWHSMEGGGFLFNSSVKNNVLSGFCVLVTQSGLKLVQITGVDVDKFRNGSYSYVQSAGKLLKTYSLSNLYGEHDFKIEVNNTSVSVWDGANVVIDGYVLPENNYGYGYGPITSHIGHSCSQQSYFTFNNISMEEVVIHYVPKKPVDLRYAVNEDSSVTLSWTQPDGKADVAGYKIYRDDRLIATTNEIGYTDETTKKLGNFTYYVCAFDSEDYTSQNSDSIVIDNLPPYTPQLTINTISDTSVVLSWQSYDNIGIVSYDLYRNNELLTSLSNNEFTDFSIKEDSTYTYYVIAKDSAGNVSDESNIVTIKTTIDESQPSVNSILPSYGKYNKLMPIKITATDTRSVSSVSVQYSYDKETWYDYATIKADGSLNTTIECLLDLPDFTNGTVYVRASALNSRNISSDISVSPIAEYYINNSFTPTQPSDLTVNTADNVINLQWNKVTIRGVSDTEVSYYVVYRSEDGVNYEIVSDFVKETEYTDTTAKIGVQYYYAVSTVDKDGNESPKQFSESCILDADVTPPEILSVTPAEGSEVGENQTISVFCYDNTEIKDIKIYGRLYGTDNWMLVHSEDIGKSSKLVKYEPNTSILDSGKYQLNIVLTDIYDNVSSENIFTYTLKKCKLSVPILVVVPGGLLAYLSWTMTNVDDLAYYKIYKGIAGDYSYVGSTTETSYTDIGLNVEEYTYYVVAVNKYGNSVNSETISVTPLDIDEIAPIADAGFDITVLEGDTVELNGTMSTDNKEIVSYHWDFGDGTTSDTSVAKHKYSVAGTYTAVLTVADEAQNVGTASIVVTVLDVNSLETELVVTSESNVPIGDAMVYYELSDGSKSTVFTNNSGKTIILSSVGTVTIYVYKQEYAPVKKTIEVSKDSRKQKIELKRQDFVIGDVKVTELDLQQMIDRGIDITAPENQAVYKCSVQATQVEDTNGNTELNLIFNSKGDIIPGTLDVENDNFYVSYDNVTKETTITRKNNGDNNSNFSKDGYTINKVSPLLGSDNKMAGIAVLRISTNITWLKECFDVELSVTNISGESFPIENAIAKLEMPKGLELAKTYEQQLNTYNMGTIDGGQTKTASWAVMGSKEGEYSISAEFSGVIMPFETDVTKKFNTSDKIKIYGGSALEYHQYSQVYTDDGMKINTTFTITNVSDKSIYNVSANLGDITELNDVKQIKLLYPDGTIIYVNRDTGVAKPEFLPALRKSDDYGYLELKPGESVTGTYFVSVSENAMQAAARAVNDLNITLDADGKICGSIVTVDTRYYENSVRAIAANLAARARNGNLLYAKEDFNPGALTVAVDITNGKTYLGLSGMGDKNPTRALSESPVITQRIDYVCQTYNCTLDEGLTSKPRNLRNCGEYNAINNALNDGANSQYLYVYTVYIGNGDYLRACENCRALFRGIVHFIGDDSEYEAIQTAA